MDDCWHSGARFEVSPFFSWNDVPRLSPFGAVGLAFDLQDDRSFDESVEESHRERTVERWSPHLSKSTLVTTAVERF
jgi:hypothetical protein